MTGRQKGNDGPEKGRAPVSIAGVWGKGDGRREEVGLGKYDGRREGYRREVRYESEEEEEG